MSASAQKAQDSLLSSWKEKVELATKAADGFRAEAMSWKARAEQAEWDAVAYRQEANEKGAVAFLLDKALAEVKTERDQWKAKAERRESDYLAAIGDLSKSLREEIEKLSAEREKTKRLREALEGTLVADGKGMLHENGCPGLDGYSCKVWCKDTRATLASVDSNQCKREALFAEWDKMGELKSGFLAGSPRTSVDSNSQSTNDGLKCSPGECAVETAQTRAETAEVSDSHGWEPELPSRDSNGDVIAGPGTGEQVGREPSPMAERQWCEFCDEPSTAFVCTKCHNDALKFPASDRDVWKRRALYAEDCTQMALNDLAIERTKMNEVTDKPQWMRWFLKYGRKSELIGTGPDRRYRTESQSGNVVVWPKFDEACERLGKLEGNWDSL